MTGGAVVPLPPPGGLHARRCVRHTTREAAARCPACGQFFCRECVVEHEGRLLCAECLRRVATRLAQRQERWRRVRRVGAMSLGGLALWLSWYGLGVLLLKIPPAFHDGTLWHRMHDSLP